MQASAYSNVFTTNMLKLMDRKKLSVAGLARLSKVSARTIHFYISGERSPTVNTVAAIANALGVSPSEMLIDRDRFASIPEDLVDKIIYLMTHGDSQVQTIFGMMAGAMHDTKKSEELARSLHG